MGTASQLSEETNLENCSEPSCLAKRTNSSKMIFLQISVDGRHPANRVVCRICHDLQGALSNILWYILSTIFWRGWLSSGKVDLYIPTSQRVLGLLFYLHTFQGFFSFGHMSYRKKMVHGEGTSFCRMGPYRFCSGGTLDKPSSGYHFGYRFTVGPYQFSSDVNPTTLSILRWSYLILSDTPVNKSIGYSRGA